MVPGIVLILLMLPMPRSPRWLAEQKRHDEGIAVVAKLRYGGSTLYNELNDEGKRGWGGDTGHLYGREVEKEYAAIRKGVEFERSVGSASWKELFSHG
ncbi:hypothetical protein HDU67_002787, partial [Dinochytrium kinnereticum]